MHDRLLKEGEGEIKLSERQDIEAQQPRLLPTDSDNIESANSVLLSEGHNPSKWFAYLPSLILLITQFGEEQPIKSEKNTVIKWRVLNLLLLLSGITLIVTGQDAFRAGRSRHSAYSDEYSNWSSEHTSLLEQIIANNTDVFIQYDTEHYTVTANCPGAQSLINDNWRVNPKSYISRQPIMDSVYASLWAANYGDISLNTTYTGEYFYVDKSFAGDWEGYVYCWYPSGLLAHTCSGGIHPYEYIVRECYNGHMFSCKCPQDTSIECGAKWHPGHDESQEKSCEISPIIPRLLNTSESALKTLQSSFARLESLGSSDIGNSDIRKGIIELVFGILTILGAGCAICLTEINVEHDKNDVKNKIGHQQIEAMLRAKKEVTRNELITFLLFSNMITKEQFPNLNKIIQGFQNLVLSGPHSENIMRFFNDRPAKPGGRMEPSVEVKVAIRY